jgi:hypothetical protein
METAGIAFATTCQKYRQSAVGFSSSKRQLSSSR